MPPPPRPPPPASPTSPPANPATTKSRSVRRIGILTGGGDCPGLNAVIRAAAKGAFARGWEIVGIHDGYDGLLPGGRASVLKPKDVRGILNLGGTILGTVNRGDPFKPRPGLPDPAGTIVKRAKALGLDAVICIGGDGTLSAALALSKRGLKVVGVPKTIDNDLNGTAITFGFDTAVSTATDALDKLHPTAASHRRVMVVEVMGRHAGWIALNSGIAGGADVILIPEIPFTMAKVCEKVEQRYRGPGFAIVVVAEGARPAGGGGFVKTAGGVHDVKFGGAAEWVSKEVERLSGRESRFLVLGHLQRGGHPTTFDRLVGTRFGAEVVRMIGRGQFGRMVSLKPPDIGHCSLAEAVGKLKLVPPGSDAVAAARELGISFGDAADACLI